MAGFFEELMGVVPGIEFGSKVTVPGLPSINTSKIESDTFSSGARANQFSLDELSKALEFLAPGALSKSSSNINNLLSGVADVEDTRAGIRNATAAGWNSGTAGGMFGNLKVVGQLGRSVGAQRQQGFQNLLALQKSAQDPTNMFLSASQRYAGATAERDDQFKRQLLANQIEAGMDPFSAEATKAMQSL